MSSKTMSAFCSFEMMQAWKEAYSSRHASDSSPSNSTKLTMNTKTKSNPELNRKRRAEISASPLSQSVRPSDDAFVPELKKSAPIAIPRKQRFRVVEDIEIPSNNSSLTSNTTSHHIQVTSAPSSPETEGLPQYLSEAQPKLFERWLDQPRYLEKLKKIASGALREAKSVKDQSLCKLARLGCDRLKKKLERIEELLPELFTTQAMCASLGLPCLPVTKEMEGNAFDYDESSQSDDSSVVPVVGMPIRSHTSLSCKLRDMQREINYLRVAVHHYKTLLSQKNM